MVLPSGSSFSQVTSLVESLEIPILRGFRLFDVYEGKPLEPGQKSYAIGFRFGLDERTLTDQECDQVMQQLMQLFEQELKAQVRR
jgi:phenylalanyl-tRNA synthetase beta chain